MDAEKKILYAMQAGILALGFTYLFGVTFFDLPKTGEEHSKTVVGFMLGTVFGTILTFNWGGSKGGRDQHEAATRQLDALLPVQPATVTQIEEAAKIDVAKVEAAKTVEAAKEE